MLYSGLCPNCGSLISEDRLIAGLPCSKCLPKKYLPRGLGSGLDVVRLRKVLESIGTVKGLVNRFLIEDELSEFSSFFTRVTGNELWSIQRAWARRILAGESFALIAPTGVGKTTLLQVYSIYKASNGQRILYVVPTRELMKQVVSSLKGLTDLVANNVLLLTPDDIKKRGWRLPDEGRVDVITHAFMHRNKEAFHKLRYDIVIVDDFDALMKSSSILGTILKVLGISEESISTALKIVGTKSELMYHKYMDNVDRVKELQEKLYSLELELAKKLDYSKVGQLLISSATGRAKGVRAKVLRELLGFEIGSIMDYMRNIVEVVESLKSVDICKLVRGLEGCTLIFVSKDYGLNYAKELVDMLRGCGFSVAIANSRRALDLLRQGRVNILVGISTYYGILTRGIDEPLKIYNVVFYGIPKFEIPIDNILSNPLALYRLMLGLTSYGYEMSGQEKQLFNSLKKLSPAKLKLLAMGLRERIELSGPLEGLKEALERDVIPRVRSFIAKYLVAKGKLVSGGYVLVKKNRRIVALTPDVMTYIQASGRCSRLLMGKMTLGLAILLYDDEDLLNIFMGKVKNYVTSFSPKKLEEIDLDRIKRLQKESRNINIASLQGSTALSEVNKVSSALIIVESPTKAKTIAKMFGSPGRRYMGEYIAYETVIATNGKVLVATLAPTFGHLFDLTVSRGLHGVNMLRRGLVPVYTSIKRCKDCGYQFTDESRKCPRCGSERIRDSMKVVNALRKLALESDVIILATDPDDEGEKIAYDVFLALRPYNSNFLRVEFHEVTRNAFLSALNKPRAIDINRVNSQVIRRVDDRLIGFELSNVLKAHFERHWLGGGRVQTPVLNWVVKRYEDYLSSRGYYVIIKLPVGFKIRLFEKDHDKVVEIANTALRSGLKIRVLKTVKRKVVPKPPYTTDTLLADASRALKLGPGAIMKIAQDLFELGLITYHRTDSTHVSPVGIEIAKNFLHGLGLDDLFTPRTWSSEGAHECIRPTKPVVDIDDVSFTGFSNITWRHKRLYEMIFRRFLSSQMKPAEIVYSVIEASVGDVKSVLEVPTEVVEKGFTYIYPVKLYSIGLPGVEALIKPVEVNVVKASKISLYTSADIIKLMKSEGIGRPSTYAKAIENNLRHGYIILSRRRMFLIPTKLGVNVVNLIRSNFPDLAEARATRELENLLTLVRKGVLKREDALVLLLADVVNIRVKYYLLHNRALESLQQATS